MKNLKFTILMLILCLIPEVFLSSQSYDRINNYWNNLYMINPGAVNDEYFGTLSTSVRQQWVSFPGAPLSLFATGTVFLEELNSQFGLKLMAEKKGITSYTDVDLTYAYEVQLNRQWDMNMGLALSYQSYHYDVSKISFPTYENPDVYNRMIDDDNLNVDVGFEFYNINWKLGVSSHNLVSLFKKETDYNPNINLAYLLYKQYNADFINWGFGVSAFQYSNMYQMEFNTTAYFNINNGDNPFYLGLFYRTWREFGAISGIKFNKKLSLAYSFDYNLGQIYRHSYASHEVMLIWNFGDEIVKCKNCNWYERHRK